MTQKQGIYNAKRPFICTLNYLWAALRKVRADLRFYEAATAIQTLRGAAASKKNEKMADMPSLTDFAKTLRFLHILLFLMGLVLSLLGRESYQGQ